MDKSAATELTVSQGGLVGRFEGVPRTSLQALYAALASTTDTISDKRLKPAIFDIDDLNQLILQLDQWTKPYDPIAKTLKIVVRTYETNKENGTRQLEFHNFEVMRKELTGRTDCVLNATLSFDFLYQDSESAQPRQCAATIDLSGRVRRLFYNIKPENPLGGSQKVYDRRFSAHFKVTYSDIIVARGLQGVIVDWYEALDTTTFPRISRLRRFLHESEFYEENDQLRILLIFLPVIFGSSLSIFIEPFIQISGTQGHDLPLWIALIAVLSLLFRLLFSFLLFKFDRAESSYFVPLSHLTSGDEKRKLQFVENIKKTEEKMNFWGTSVLVAFAVSTLASVAVWYFSG